MGLSSLPAPSQGVFCVLLVNTALSLSLFKGIVRTILHIIGIRLSSSPASPSSSSPTLNSTEDYAENRTESVELFRDPCYTYIEEFRSRVPAIRFDGMCGCEDGGYECSVCLTQFKPESEINHLSCGHVFHKVCLEKWLDYWNITCPLCRTPLLPEEDVPCFW